MTRSSTRHLTHERMGSSLYSYVGLSRFIFGFGLFMMGNVCN